MGDRFPVLLVFTLVLLAVLGGFLVQGSKRGAFADRFSTHRSEPDGARAIALLLEAQGVPVQRWQVPFDHLDGGSPLVLLGPSFEGEHLVDAERWEGEGKAEGALPSGEDAGATVAPDDDAAKRFERELDQRGASALRVPPISEDEREALLAHVRAGATVVYVPWGPVENDFLRALGVRLRRAPWPADAVRDIVPMVPSRWLRGVERLQATSSVALGSTISQDGLVLLSDEETSVGLAALMPLERGRVIVLAAPELATNRALGLADNAQLWTALGRALSASGPVAFDEYHHGFTTARSIGAFASRYGLRFAGAQLLLGAALWALSLRRLGRAREAPEVVRVESTDALSATSRLYREGRHVAHAAGAILQHVTAELAAAAGLSPRSSPTEVAHGLEARGRAPLAARLRELAARATAVRGDASLRRVADEAAALRAQLDQTRRTRRST